MELLHALFGEADQVAVVEVRIVGVAFEMGADRLDAGFGILFSSIQSLLPMAVTPVTLRQALLGLSIVRRAGHRLEHSCSGARRMVGHSAR